MIGSSSLTFLIFTFSFILGDGDGEEEKSGGRIEL